MRTTQNSTKFIKQVARNAGRKRIQGFWVFVVELISLLRNIVALSLAKVTYLRWNLRQASFIRRIHIVSLIVAIIHSMSSFSVFIACSLVIDVGHAWLQGRDAVSCKAISANHWLALIEFKLILEQTFVIMVSECETCTGARWWDFELVDDFFP